MSGFASFHLLFYQNSRLVFWAAVIFFMLVLALGLLTFTHYGISTDERVDYLTGLVNAKYVLQTLAPDLLAKFSGLESVPDLSTFQDRHYGVIYQLPAAVLPAIFGLTDSRDIYFARHLLTFLYFFGGLILFYQILKHRFGKGWWPLIGCLFLVLSPRIYADSFYNGKDIVFLSLTVFAWFTLTKFRGTLTWKWVVFHAFASALAIDSRIMGLLVPALTMLWLAHIGFYQPSGKFRKKVIIRFAVYLVLVTIIAIICWPYLWEAPWNNFLGVFQKLKRESSFPVLYFGQYIPFDQLPWHYIPAWIFITTPVTYSVLFITGLVAILVKLFRFRIALLHTSSGQQDATAIMLFFIPLAAVIFTNAVVYDGWRHLFFIYPAFIYVAIIGLRQVFRFLQKNGSGWMAKTVGIVLVIFTVAEGLRTVYLMVKMHPNQNVYFSFLPAEYVERSLERDYWGLSYRQGLEYILNTDPRPVIKVYPNFVTGSNSYDILKPADQQRLRYVSEAEADYVLTEYRFDPPPYPYSNEVFTVKPNGLKIMSVFKVK